MPESIERDFLDDRVLGRLAGLPLFARFPMLGQVSGRHHSPIRGSSLEFSEYRKYVPGDDTRRLDWRAFGRSDRFYLKEFEADTNLRLCLIVDTSGSMKFGAEGSKLEYARRVAGTLAYLAVRQGDAVGLHSAAAELALEIPPRRSAAHLRHVLDAIGSLTAGGETGLVEVLHDAAEKIQKRALVVIISDLFVRPALLRRCFQHLRFRLHDVVVFHLLERQEVELDLSRPTRFLDLETGGSILAEPALILRQYHRSLELYLVEIREIMRDANVDYHRVLVHEGYESVLARFLLGRAPKRARR